MLEPVMEYTGYKRNGNRIYRLLEPLEFIDRHGVPASVPAGFESDLITGFFLSKLIVRSDYRPARAAAFFHDYYLNHPDLRERKRANDLFSGILRFNRVPGWKRWIMVTWVRWWTV